MVSEQPDEQHRCRCRRPLTDAWFLCESCSARLGDDLLEVASRFHRLDARPSPEPGRYDRTSSGKPGSRPPVRLDVVGLRDDRASTGGAVDTLDQWAWRLCAHRGYDTAPDQHVDALVEFLNRHDDVIARWERAPELFDAVRKLRNHRRAATGEPNPKPAAFCVAFLDTDDGPRECGAAVFLPEHAGDAASYQPVVRCTGDARHEYTRGDLLRLALANQQGHEHREAG